MIDFHLSFRSRTFFDRLAEASPRRLSVDEGLARLGDGRQAPADSNDAHLEAWLTALDAHRVAHAVALAGCEEEIPLVAEAAARSKGRLVPFTPLDPTAEDAVERVEHLLGSTGFAGVVLDPGRDGYRVSEERTAAALEAVESHGGVALVRCGLFDRELERAFGIAPRFDADCANPLHLQAAADRHPRLSFVVPRFGGGLLRELLLVGSACPNVLVDTSSDNAWMVAQPEPMRLVDVFERALAVFGPTRLLFGSDSSDPASGWCQRNLTHQSEAMGACGISLEDRELVLDGNARRLLGLPEPARSEVTQTS